MRTPPQVSSRRVICFMAPGLSEVSNPAACSSSQALGPLTVTLPQSGVTGLISTWCCTYSHCSHSSKARAILSAPPEVVLIQKWFSDSRATMPSSTMTPFSFSSRP